MDNNLFLDNERYEVNETMMTQIISNTNTPDDLSRNVIDVLYYIPKVSFYQDVNLIEKLILYYAI